MMDRRHRSASRERASRCWVALLAGPIALLAIAFGPSAAFAQPSFEGDLGAAQQAMEVRRSERARRESELTTLQDREQEARGRLRERVRTLYRLQRKGLLPVAGGLEALVAHRARLHRLGRLVARDSTTTTRLSRQREVLKESLARLDEELRGAEEAMQGMAWSQQQQAEALSTERQFTETFAASSSDPALYQTPGGYGTMRLSQGGRLGAGFASLRGYLEVPVARSSQVREGRREDGIGLEFLSAAGSTVRAAADGRVAFADHYGDYGQLVVLDHGNDYFTVYGGLAEVHVRLGASVLSAASLGTVGLDGPTRGLYFEVRRGTRALDAPSWLGL